MWVALLFGWLIGENRRNARNAGLPDRVKQQRYDAELARRERRRAARAEPWVRWAVVGMIAVLIVIGLLSK